MAGHALDLNDIFFGGFSRHLVSAKDGNFIYVFFHLHHLYLATLDVTSFVYFVLGLWSNSPATSTSSASTTTSTTTSQLQQLHGSFLGGKHLMLTSLLAHTTALHCVWFLPFHTRGGSDRSPGAGHRSGRLSQGALPVSGMPWGPVWGLLCQPSIYHFVNLLMYGAPCAAS